MSRGLLLAAFAAAALASACRDLPVDPFARLDTGVGSGGTGGSGAGDMDSGAAGAGGTVTCPNRILGFATVNGVTTGGADAPAATPVSTLADLMAAAGQTAPAVIVIQGMLVAPQTSTGFQVNVTSNKTIIGADAQSGLTGGGFLILSQSNVIIQNLKINLAVATDAITVQASSHVWIDHCDLSSDVNHSTGYYGFLVNVKHASDFVTVSWTRFHDHFNTFQIGHSDMNGAEDMGHLTVTSHHNLFQTTNSGEPRVRFGSVHVVNNVFSNVGDYAIASQMGAQVVVVGNTFTMVRAPLSNQEGDPTTSTPGQFLFPTDQNMIQVDATNGYGINKITPTPGLTFTFDPSKFYSYTPDSVDGAAFIVAQCAGTGTY